MEDFFEFFKFILVILGSVVSVLIVIVVLGFGGYVLNSHIDYALDKTYCTAFVNGKSVWTGRCHFVFLQSIGENGNTKQLTIFKDKSNLKPLMHYVSNDIRINKEK